FADLEGRLEAAAAAQLADDVAERARAERSGVALSDRLQAHRGPLEVLLRDGSLVSGDVADGAPQWLLLRDGPREHLVPARGVAAVGGLTDAVAVEAGVVLSRLGLGHVLRGIAQDRSVVLVRAAGVVLAGRVDAVGADHLDLAELAPDTHRPTGRRRAVAFDAIDLISRA
ncbi:MAG TPA: hypothetical protein PKB06_08415, partial [Actinotalea sp.]|nr:hypothetical protein [Actinotalea sp.]